MLIDTHALIWYAMGDNRLSARAAKVIMEAGNEYSIASVWEAAIKSGLGRLELKRGKKRITAREFFDWVAAELELTPLPILISDACGVERLSQHHSDPFDRLLIAQAIKRKLPIVSADRIFDAYGVARVW